MTTMRTIATLLSWLVCGAALASGGADLRLDPAPIHRLDAESLQRGARNFVNYCLNCHSAKYMRYERLKDIGLNEQQIKDNLMFGTDKIGSTMTVAMTAAEGKAWFGAVPPDLSVEARVRGTDWLYNYLLGFYRDDSTPTGWNNLVFPNVGMPHVLWTLTGPTQLVSTEFDSHEKALAASIAKKGLVRIDPGTGGKYLVRTVAADPNAAGAMSPAEYQAFVADLVNYMDYMAEPTRNERVRLGIVVMMYLAVLFVLVYALKRMYWKNLH
jgi:ubiquinol-cytochrome c reductase cytochrome c1 subunit